MRIPPSQRNVNEKKYLYTFLENGDVPINNRAENAIRPFIACGNAVSTYTAQNLGAGKKERIREGYKASVLLCAGIAVIEFAVIMLLSFRHRNRHGLHDRPCVLLYNNGNKFKLQRNVKGAWVFEAVFYPEA